MTGARRFRSMRMPSSVLIRLMPSAPASAQARAMAAMSVTLGLSFTNTGFCVTAFTARVTSAAQSGSVPKLMPPWETLGQLTLISSRPISGAWSNSRAE